MLLINKSDKTLSSLERRTMREAGFWERRDIQQLICRSPNEFCKELGEYIHMVGSEIQPAQFVQDRIDLLGIDANGTAVVIELKRDNHKLHLLQALSYAGMVAKWEPKQFVESLRGFNARWASQEQKRTQTFEDAREELEEVLEDGDVEVLNRNQRVILLAEEFDYEVLVTCEWLTEKFDVDIRCYRLALAKKGDDEFLTCTTAYPPPELTDIAIRRRRTTEIGDDPKMEWTEVVKKIQNEAVVAFFSKEIAKGGKLNLRYRALNFYIGDRRPFIVYAKHHFARVFQSGRFEKDIDFWRSRLSSDARIEPLKNGRSLRFYLNTSDDFDKFSHAATNELLTTHFTNEVNDDAVDDEEE